MADEDRRASRDMGRLVSNLQERILSVYESGDPALALEGNVKNLTQTLTQLLVAQTNTAPDVEAVSVLVDMHWLRYQLLPEGQDEYDLGAFISLSALLLGLAPHLVPEPVRSSVIASMEGVAVAREVIVRLQQGAREAVDVERLALLAGHLRQAVAGHLSDCGAAWLERFEQTGLLQDVEESVTASEKAVAATAPLDHAFQARPLSNLGIALRTRFEQTGNLRDLDRAVISGYKSVVATPLDHPRRTGRLSNYGAALQVRFDQTGKLQDLQHAIDLFREAVESSAVRHPRTISNLAGALRARYLSTGRLGDLDEAIELFQKVLASIGFDQPDRPGHLSRLSVALKDRFIGKGQPEDLELAVSLAETAVVTVAPNHSQRPSLLCELGCVLRLRFDQLGRLEDLNRAITLLREARTYTEPGHSNWPMYTVHLGDAHRARFQQTQLSEELNQAIVLLQEAWTETPPGHGQRPACLSALGKALRDRFQRAGELADLNQAITCFQEALTKIPANHMNRPAALVDLGNARRLWFERTGKFGDLIQAVICFQEALATLPPGHPERPGCLFSLAVTLQLRYKRGGQFDDLEQAIAVGQEAATTIARDHRERAATLSSVGGTLRMRFERTGQLHDIDRAVAFGEEAVNSAPDHHNRSAHLSNLGGSLQVRFARTQQPQDLDQAIDLFRQAVVSTSVDHPVRAVHLSHLGLGLRTRFERTAELSDLEQAISAGRAAVIVTPVDHPDRPAYLCNLGGSLQIRFEWTREFPNLDEAIEWFRLAVDASPTDHPDRAGYLYNLAGSLQTRSEWIGSKSDLMESITLSRDGTEMITAAPLRRLFAARQWAMSASLARDAVATSKAYTAAIELLPLVAWHGLDQTTREHHLKEWGGLASEAVAAAVAAGSPKLAVEVAEAGRTMLWTQVLNLRSDLTALRAHESGYHLADSLARVLAVLDAPGASAGLNSDIVADPEQAHAVQGIMLTERRQAAREWDEVVHKIRQIKGFKNFLRPAPFSHLRSAADKGPVIIVNVSRWRCDALIVKTSGVTVLELTALSLAEVSRRTERYLAVLQTAEQADEAYQRVRDSDDEGIGAAQREFDAAEMASSAQRHVDEMLSSLQTWMWDVVADPVLKALGYTQTPQGPAQSWPRLWWCPTGLFTLLPLHTAGHHMGGQEVGARTVLDRVISSYTPTLRALIKAREPRREAETSSPAPDATKPSPNDTMLLVIADEAVGQASLSGGAEQAALAERLPDTSLHVLRSKDAVRDVVLAALPSYRWVHFSCHGAQDLHDPSKGLLQLNVRSALTIADITAKRFDGEFAGLSACKTAIGGIDLLDETITLAAALHYTGYRHVVATLWSVEDSASSRVFSEIYARIIVGHRPQSRLVATALHDAVRGLRRHHRDSPQIWTPFTHTGP